MPAGVRPDRPAEPEEPAAAGLAGVEPPRRVDQRTTLESQRPYERGRVDTTVPRPGGQGRQPGRLEPEPLGTETRPPKHEVTLSTRPDAIWQVEPDMSGRHVVVGGPMPAGRSDRAEASFSPTRPTDREIPDSWDQLIKASGGTET